MSGSDAPSAPAGLQVLPVPGLPEISVDSDLAALIVERIRLQPGDVVVVSQKVVSKLEGAVVAPRPGESRAAARARLARDQTARIVADAPWAQIVETVHGFVCANAGVDASNVPDGKLALLPADPDASARRLRGEIGDLAGVDVGIIIADTFGRPWRLGQTDVALGVAGVTAIASEIGTLDRHGARLDVTEVALADELAAAADLVRRKADGVPVVVVRGLRFPPDDQASGRDLLRPAELDLFPRGRGGLQAALVATGGQPVGPVEAGDLLRAAGTLEQVCGEGIRMRTRRRGTSQAGTEIELQPAGSVGPAKLGVAAGLLLAVLTDLGYKAVLVASDPEPRIRAGRVDPRRNHER